MIERDERTRRTEESVFGIEEALAKMSIEFMNPKDEKLMTTSDLTPNEIFLISRLIMLSEKFKSDIVGNWARKFMLLRVSLLRKGRGEFVVLGTGLREAGEEKRKSMSIRNLLMR